MKHCPKCRTAYADEVIVCPICEEVFEDSTFLLLIAVTTLVAVLGTWLLMRSGVYDAFSLTEVFAWEALLLILCYVPLKIAQKIHRPQRPVIREMVSVYSSRIGRLMMFALAIYTLWALTDMPVPSVPPEGPALRTVHGMEGVGARSSDHGLRGRCHPGPGAGVLRLQEKEPYVPMARKELPGSNPVRQYPTNAKMLEYAGSLLMVKGHATAAGGVFAKLASREPGNPIGWAGLADAMGVIALKEGRSELIRGSIGCARRALAERHDFTPAAETLTIMRDRGGLTRSEVDSISTYQGSPMPLANQAGYEASLLWLAVKSLPDWGDRMKLVMWLGEQGDSDFVPLLVQAGDADQHPDVRSAAVKRLGTWPDRDDVKDLLERLVKSHRFREIEPYVSFTLHEIDRPWSKELLRQIESAR